MTIRLSRILLVAGIVALGMPAFAASWKPSQPVRLIVPVQGATVDLLARLVAPHLQQAFGEPVLVEAQPVASGDLGTDLVAKAAPDETTILVDFTAPNLPYDPLKDLLPIMLAVSTPQFLTIIPAVPTHNVHEFVAYAKAHAGQLNYGSVLIGSASHLTMEMFKAAAGIKMVHVPYEGAAPAVAELLAGHVQAAMLVPGSVMPYLPSGKLRVLATTWRKRFSGAPDIPIVSESGYPGFEAIAWIGFTAPARTPQAVINRYDDEIAKTLALPDVRQRLTGIYFDVVASAPELGDAALGKGDS